MTVKRIRLAFFGGFVLITLISNTGCRALGDALFDSLLGGDDRYASRGSPDEAGISSREKRRRLEEIHINKTTSTPDWNWSPNEP